MKDVIIKMYKDSSVYTESGIIGINYENLQGKLVFEFVDEFVDGTAYLEFERKFEKGLIPMNKVGKTYEIEIKSSLLKEIGNIELQLRITQDSIPSGIPVYKSKVFTLEVLDAINATSEIPDEYPEWIDLANEKIKEMDNLNITTERVEDGVDIVLTDKKGNTTRTEVKDGTPGPQGPQGEPGAVKMQVVDTLPETGETDTIYLVKKDNPGEQNLYDEYVYTDTGWEHIGDTSVDLSDYYTKNEVNNKLATISKVYYWEEGNTGEESITIFQEMINDLINGGNPILSNKYSNDTSATADYRIGGSDIYTFPTDLDITTLSTYTGDIVLRRFGYSSVGVTSGTVSRTWVRYKVTITLKDGTVTKINGPMKLTAYFGDKIWEGGADTTILCAENTRAYTPTSDYNPTTKKYVDDAVATKQDILTYSMYLPTETNVTDTEKLQVASDLINNLYTSGSNNSFILHNLYTDLYTGDSYDSNMLMNGAYAITNTKGTFKFMSINNSATNNTEVSIRGHILYIFGTWSDDVFTANRMLLYKSGDLSLSNLNSSFLNRKNTTSYTPIGDYNPATKKYVDDLPTTYAGYDATKTQVLKNINGTLTWVDE